MNDWISLPEAADLLGVTPSGLRKRARRNTIPALKMGGRWLISRAWLEQETDWALQLFKNTLEESTGGTPEPVTVPRNRTVTIEGYRLKQAVREHFERLHGANTQAAEAAIERYWANQPVVIRPRLEAEANHIVDANEKVNNKVNKEANP